MSAALTVLHSLAPPDGRTKYVDQITAMAPPEVTVRYFSWRTALRGRYDVLHLHWPELLLRARSRRKRAAKRLALLVLLASVRLRRIPVVRTVHNTAPHEAGSALERALLAAIDASTGLFIRLNPTTPLPGGRPAVTILHGHYRDRFADAERSRPQRDRVLYAGILRPYKGVDRLLGLAGELSAAGVAVRVVGSPSPDVRALVEDAVAAHDNVSARLEFVPDEDLVAEVTAAELVVLPYRELQNSGVLLVALSLDRPVLVPTTPSTRALAEEAGEGWVLLYDGLLEAEHVSSALRAVRSPGRASRPHLEGRDWDVIGRQHADAYGRAVAEVAR